MLHEGGNSVITWYNIVYISKKYKRNVNCNCSHQVPIAIVEEEELAQSLLRSSHNFWQKAFPEAGSACSVVQVIQLFLLSD